MGFWRDLVEAFSRNPYEPPPPPRPYLTPEIVEAAIDKAGRSEVFALARQNGWTHGNAPMWVWYQLAHQVINREQERPYAPALLPSPQQQEMK
jgi:hypothetical protein